MSDYEKRKLQIKCYKRDLEFCLEHGIEGRYYATRIDAMEFNLKMDYGKESQDAS